MRLWQLELDEILKGNKKEWMRWLIQVFIYCINGPHLRQMKKMPNMTQQNNCLFFLVNVFKSSQHFQFALHSVKFRVHITCLLFPQLTFLFPQVCAKLICLLLTDSEQFVGTALTLPALLQKQLAPKHPWHCLQDILARGFTSACDSCVLFSVLLYVPHMWEL